MAGSITSKQTLRKHISWQIPNYYSYSQRADDSIDSPEFSFFNRTWKLRVYPNGRRSNFSVEWVGLYLEPLSSAIWPWPLNGFPRMECFIEYFEDNCNKRYPTNSECIAEYVNVIGCIFYGRSRLIGRHELKQLRPLLVKDGYLRICVVIDVPTMTACSTATQTTSFDGSNKLGNDFGTLFQSEHKSDVTIKVGSRNFKAHKLILGARSSVFAAMFKHNMRENCCGVIDIVDCEPDIFQLFLEFVYTGSLQNMSSENVSGLLTIADKYDLPDLKERCLLHMKDALSLDIVCDVVDAANKYYKEELLNDAKKLLIKNYKTVTSTQKWLDFLKNNPGLGTEILLSLISVD